MISTTRSVHVLLLIKMIFMRLKITFELAISMIRNHIFLCSNLLPDDLFHFRFQTPFHLASGEFGWINLGPLQIVFQRSFVPHGIIGEIVK